MVLRAFSTGAPRGAAGDRPSLRRRGLGRVAAVSLATVGVVVFAMAAPAAAVATGTVVTWTGNGTTAGACNNVGPANDLNPGPGEEGWLFILTSPFDATGSNLTFSFTPTAVSSSPVAGVHKGGGGGTYHYAVYTQAGAVLNTASATNGTETSVLTVSHCELGGPNGEQPGSAITSAVHNAAHTVITNGSPGTAPANVHDQVTLTVTGLDHWSGTITLKFFTTNDCNVDHVGGTFTDTWDETTTMPQDNLLPEGPLSTGEYSYRESFHFVSPDNQELDVTGACEPFKIVDPTTTPVPSPSPSLPKTGDSVAGIAVTGAVLLVAGALMIAFVFVGRRRRSAAESNQ
jgi:hypothetical protein